MTGAILIFWAGYTSAISFMEAWLKFRAEGVTKETGLAIGKKVFTALNRMEWIFFLASTAVYVLIEKEPGSQVLFMMLFLGVIMVFQSFYSLPILRRRATAIIQGKPVKPSSVHVIHGTLEVLKVLALLIAASQWFIRLG